MAITTIQSASNNQKPAVAPRPIPCQSFAALLGCQDVFPPAPNADQNNPPEDKNSSPSPAVSPEPNAVIPLGEISKTTPSVCHLLLSHPTLRQECWDIISAKVNQGKPFKAMRPGMIVSLNPTTKELTWSKPSPQPAIAATDEGTPPKQRANDSQIVLGKIDPDTPTVSHVLKSSPRYRDQAWDIIFSAANRKKPYASIQPGCLVTINPQTLELGFEENDGVTASPAPTTAKVSSNPVAPTADLPDDQKSFAEKLAESVRSYLGQPYQKIDCYSLVVHGLKNQGVKYSGSGGLLQHLEQLATRRGLPANAYQNGEGLIEVAGNKLYDESFVHIKNAEQQSNEVFTRLQPLLHEGMLLSFSTPTRGHTGVIAKKDGLWTYVNSGVIDHQVNGGKVSWRVGEERLADEIKNWFVLAKKNATSLKVSAGMFDTKKLQATGSMVATSRSRGQKLI